MVSFNVKALHAFWNVLYCKYIHPFSITAHPDQGRRGLELIAAGFGQEPLQGKQGKSQQLTYKPAGLWTVGRWNRENKLTLRKLAVRQQCKPTALLSMLQQADNTLYKYLSISHISCTSINTLMSSLHRISSTFFYCKLHHNVVTSSSLWAVYCNHAAKSVDFGFSHVSLLKSSTPFPASASRCFQQTSSDKPVVCCPTPNCRQTAKGTGAA